MKNKRLIRFWVNPESDSRDAIQKMLGEMFDEELFEVVMIPDKEVQEILNKSIQEQAGRN